MTDMETVKARHPKARKAYMEWAYAGGPNECVHGYAKGIPCPLCDEEKAQAPHE